MTPAIRFLWLAVSICLALVPLLSDHAWADELQPIAETELEGPAEADAPPEESLQHPRRRIRPFRPPVLTKEEREEAERRKKLAAKMGTDPTAVVGRVQLFTEYADLDPSGNRTDVTLRVDLPWRKNFLLQMILPFQRWSDPDRLGTTSVDGRGDLGVNFAWRAYNTAEYSLLVGVGSSFPTANDDRLSSGKYTVGPILATARYLPALKSFLFGLVTHQLSVGGDPSRKDVQLTGAAAQINTIWAEKWWTTVQGVWIINWELNEKTSMKMEFEFGRNFINTWGAYVRPGVGIWGQSAPGTYNWNVEVGVRYVFGSF
jgi:hypothetical protein